MRKTKIGYQLDFRNPPTSTISFRDLYRHCFEQVQAAEAMGFDSIWLTEHHFTDDGYLPAMMPAAAAIAARTTRVTIGTYVLLAPFVHPLKLAEDSAFVDVLSGGRLRLGIGQGYRAEEFDGFGIPRAERLGRTLETLEILKLAWTGERFSFDGKYFKFRDVRVLPRPVSQPYPELLWGAGAPKAIRRAAKLDLSFACVGGRKEAGIYIEALKAAGKDPSKYNIVANRAVYVANSEEEAWRDTRDALMYQAELYGKWLSAAAGTTDQSKVLIRPDPERLRRTSVLGTPAEVRDKLNAILDATPFTELIVVTQLPGLDPAKARRSLDRFGLEVLPQLR
ncbi:MAG: LLM class flavin-dependent oxidoreductase [Candidatus Binatus sp.]|uniref:LLM class flavin-dependent oxidoreductase n=1 Tax=Candidatus Binatus sp. TaxID=2811406 RepID=UPI0027162E32|nr:LLM class flavin-dependent oxidoreductase [Candidatus Binatus sp.]MDO8430882.1 LLM class flavin-dependent oxidoreductase [Candidatus Binatus sp.]